MINDVTSGRRIRDIIRPEAGEADIGVFSNGASVYDDGKIFGFFDPLPPLSANSHNLPY